MRRKAETATKGSCAFENWNAFKNGSPQSIVYEYPLFSDASFSRDQLEKAFGPFKLIHTQRISNSLDEPCFVVRISDHIKATDRTSVRQMSHDIMAAQSKMKLLGYFHFPWASA
jgi:hypothetical protein